MFDIGQEVVCVDDTMQHLDGHKLIHNGQHYIISWIGELDHPLLGKDLCVRLDGITRPPEGFDGLDIIVFKVMGWDKELLDMPFRADRFRPIERQTTDISALKSLLAPTDVTEDA